MRVRPGTMTCVWSIRIRSWHGMWSSVLTAFALVVGCGDDDGDDGVVDTTGTATISTTEASSSEESTTSGADGSSSSTGEGSTGTTGEESSDGADTTTGGSGDPAYPPTDGGACPPGTAPIQLPGASMCGPFCEGAEAECPPPASGDAVPTCTPFEEKGGSGTPCRMHDECPEGEACDTDGTCVAVAFWACRLVCDAGQTCSDDMTCAAGACGYP